MNDDLNQIRAELGHHHRMLYNHFVETDQRFGSVGEQMTDLGHRMVALGTELVGLRSNSDERWAQLSGRSKLLEQRVTKVLEAADRVDVRRYCELLDERLTRLEGRLDPPAA